MILISPDDLSEIKLTRVTDIYGRVTGYALHATPLYHFNYVVCFASASDVKKNFVNKVVKPGDNGNLLFTKSSKFPRHKLNNTPYRRVLKYEDADYVVYNPSALEVQTTWKLPNTSSVLMFRTEDSPVWYIVDGNVFDQVWKGPFVDTRENLFFYVRKVMEFAAHNNPKAGKGIVFPKGAVADVYYGKVSMFPKDSLGLLDGVINQGWTNLIKDNSLETVLQGYLPETRANELDNLLLLLESPDDATNEIGWKTMASMDILKYSTLSKVIVYTFLGSLAYDVYNLTSVRSMMSYLKLDFSKHQLQDNHINYKCDIFNARKAIIEVRDKNNSWKISNEEVNFLKPVIERLLYRSFRYSSDLKVLAGIFDYDVDLVVKSK